MREKLGTLLPEEKKPEGAKVCPEHAFLLMDMKALFSKLLRRSDHSEHDVAAKSQRVLEDALIRNIQMQKDLANIGEEVARLQEENKELRKALPS